MIEELTRKREEHIKSCIENNDYSHQIIADMYSDPSHFIYELLQNAEDANAKEINFKLSDDKLIVWHNGIDFTYDDIDAITSIGNSTKRDEVNQIGKFGAGFKSVFSITKSPKIYSGVFKFEINDFIIPKEITDNYEGKGTKFIFPFNTRKPTPDEIYGLIKKKLKELENEILLFLNNIVEIQWETTDEKGSYIKEHQDKRTYDENCFYEKVFVTSEINNKSIDTEYLLFNQYSNLENNNLIVNIAYKIENNKIVKANSPYLSVYFPTKIETDLNFLIHAPYKTTPSRETVPLNDEENTKLTNTLINLFTKSLIILRDNNFIDIQFLNDLPLEKNFYNKPIYANFQKELMYFLKNEEILPAINGNYIKSIDAILARGKELVNLLSNDDLEKLFNKKYWLSTEITRDKTSKLRNFIINDLGVPEKDFEDFAKALNLEFLEAKSDEWFIKFYTLLSNQGALFNQNGVLRHKEIIKLENDKFASLYDEEDRINVYLPRKDKSNYKIVKRLFIENELSKLFFEKYNVSYPDRLAELKEFIAPKYLNKHSIPFEEYKSDFDKIITTYKNADRTKRDIIELFKDKYIVYTNNNEYQKPNNVYIPSDLLISWFENQNVNFISEKIYSTENKLFFEEISCHSFPKRIEIEPQLTCNEKEKLTNGYHSVYDIREIETKDFTIDGLDVLLEHISIEKSLLIWEVLEKHFISFEDWNKKNFFKGVFKWSHYGTNTKYFPAFFTNTLKQNRWLYDIKRKLVKPTEIAISDLLEDYKGETEFLKAIDEIFSFKTDEIKKLEEKGYAVVPKEDKEAFEEWKRNQKNKNEDEKKEWQPKIKPEEVVEVKVEKFENNKKNVDLSNQEMSNKSNENSNHKTASAQNKKEKPQVKNKYSKEIGNWGEEVAYKYLKENFKKYQVIWLNQNGNIGKGYDFVIKNQNEEIFYIEVKTKTDNKPELIEITGTQWEWARMLNDKGNGEKYIIYVVLNAGESEKIKIKEIINPIEKWKNGELKAHPVNFEL